MAFGTAGYAPPELYNATQSDALSDVYSLGATLHSLLTGFDPTPALFSLPPLRQLNGTISVPLEQIVTKALALQPQQRRPDMKSMRSALATLPLAPVVPIT